MFPRHYYPARMFGRRYFPQSQGIPAIIPTPPISSRGLDLIRTTRVGLDVIRQTAEGLDVTRITNISAEF